jgi:hypothetical protein
MMNSTPDHASLSITRDNRHQYLETAIVSASEADLEIRQAEARGVARRAREKELKQTLKRTAFGALALMAAGAGLLIFLR